MDALNRAIVLHTLIKHETLTIDDLAKKENLGLVPDKLHLQYLLDELIQSGEIDMLDGIVPPTYTITNKGIVEGERILQEENK